MKATKQYMSLLLALVMLLSLAACGNESSERPGDETSAPEPLLPTEFVESEYANNPQIEKAVKLDDQTVRVSFTQPVRMEKGGIGGVVYTPASGNAVKASDYAMHGYSKDKDGVTYATIFDFTFPASVSGGKISFEGTKTEGSDVINGVLSAFGGAGLYGGKEGCEAALSDGTIKLPTEEVRMVRAIWTDKAKGKILMVFSVPVRNLLGWNTFVFVSDVSSPNPGVGGSWQYPIRSARAVDQVRGKDGKVYATTWEVTVSANSIALKSIPAKGVLRISENDSKAPDEYASATDNFDCGRVVVAIDGRPLLAENIRGWDVSYAWFE